MRKASLLVALTLTACASAPPTRPETPVEATPTAPVVKGPETDREMAAALRAISARVKKGEAVKVREELAEQLRAKPTDPRLKILISWIRAPSEDAWQEIAMIGKLHPTEPWALTCSGLIYLQWRGFLDQADSEFVRVLRNRPGFVPALVGRADVLRLKGKYSEAKAGYEAVLAKEPGWHEAMAGLGLTLAALDDPSARETLKRAYSTDPNDPALVAALAKIAVAVDDRSEAIELHGRMLEFNPRDREARLTLAKMREQAGDLTGAAADIEAALKLSADAMQTRKLVELYRALKRTEDELRALESLASLDANEVDALLRVAELRKADKDLEAAEAAMRQAAERRPDDAAVHLAVARLVRERDDLVGAIEAYRVARQKGAREAVSELRAVEAKACLSSTPLRGDVNQLYRDVFQRLRQEYKVRQKSVAGLAGKIRVRVSVGEDGRASQVELLEDSVHDGVLVALVYYSLKDAIYPNAKRTPTFEFVLSPN